MNFFKKTICIAFAISTIGWINIKVLSVSPHMPATSYDQTSTNMTDMPTPNPTPAATKRERPETFETKGIESPLQKQRLETSESLSVNPVTPSCKQPETKDEKSIRIFLTQLFRGKRIANKKVFTQANIYINFTEFLFNKTVTNYSVESIGLTYVCKLDTFDSSEIFLVLRPYGLYKNPISFDIKTAYEVKGKTITQLTKRQLIESLIKEFQINSQTGTAHSLYIAKEKVKSLQKLLCKMDVQYTLFYMKMRSKGTLTPLTYLSPTTKHTSSDTSPKLISTNSKKLIESLISKLYEKKKITFKQTQNNSRIYIGKQYLFARSIFCYDVEGHGPVYICLLSKGKKCTKYFSKNEHFILLEPKLSTTKNVCFSIRGICKTENKDIEILTEKEIYIQLIHEITKSSSYKNQTTPSAKNNATIKNLSAMQTAAKDTLQIGETQKVNLYQISKCPATKETSTHPTCDLPPTPIPIDQLPLSTETINKLFPIIMPTSPTSEPSRPKRRRRPRVKKKISSAKISAPEQKTSPDQKEHLFKSLCKTAEVSYQALKKIKTLKNE